MKQTIKERRGTVTIAVLALLFASGGFLSAMYLDRHDKPVRVHSPLLSGSGHGQTPASQNEQAQSSGAESGVTSSKSSDMADSPQYLSQGASAPSQPCNEQLKAAYDEKRTTDIAHEISIHDNYHPAAQPDSSDWANLMDEENARHLSALADIEAAYRSKMATVSC